MDKEKRLIKNTLYLYLRMFFQLSIALYTSRVILDILGVIDYGIYNLIGGFVSMFSIVSNSLSSSVSRKLTFEIGVNNKKKTQQVFISAINIHIILSLFAFILLESIGLWFINNKMNLPQDRIGVANIVFQASIFTFCLSLLTIPYNAIIIAKEKMKAFANIGIIEIVLKLIIVLLIPFFHFNKLLTYCFLLAIVTIIIQIIYIIYCRNTFPECKYHVYYNKRINKELFCFAGWNFIGTTSAILKDQGSNLILNLFFGPIVNSARAISMQVNSAITGFVNNFTTALMPQITKSYASSDYHYLLNCIYKGSKYSYFLLYILSLPILLRTEYILNLWLKEVPQYTIDFVRLILIYSLTDTYSRNLINANNATGNIKHFQLITGLLNILILPIAYFSIQYSNNPNWAFYVTIIISIINILPRILLNHRYIPITLIDFLKEVLYPTISCSIASLAIIYPINKLIPDSFIGFCQICLYSFILNIALIYLLSTKKEEKAYIKELIHTKLKKEL